MVPDVQILFGKHYLENIPVLKFQIKPEIILDPFTLGFLEAAVISAQRSKKDAEYMMYPNNNHTLFALYLVSHLVNCSWNSLCEYILPHIDNMYETDEIEEGRKFGGCYYIKIRNGEYAGDMGSQLIEYFTTKHFLNKDVNAPHVPNENASKID